MSCCRSYVAPQACSPPPRQKCRPCKVSSRQPTPSARRASDTRSRSFGPCLPWVLVWIQPHSLSTCGCSLSHIRLQVSLLLSKERMSCASADLALLASKARVQQAEEQVVQAHQANGELEACLHRSHTYMHMHMHMHANMHTNMHLLTSGCNHMHRNT